MVGSEVLIKKGLKLYYHPSKIESSNPTVILVHHMWGSHRSVLRHANYLNSIGFNCISFDFIFGTERFKIASHPLLRYLYKGVFYVWMRQIRLILDEIPGDKIVYSFSGPSLSALWASDNRNDVVKMICDGGPFHEIRNNTRNFFRKEAGISNEFLNGLSALIGTTIWGIHPLRKLHKVLNAWKPNVPILSIRGTEDDIVLIDTIDRVFAPHPQLPLTVVEIKGGRHLNGLRDFPDIYTQELKKFILQ